MSYISDDSKALQRRALLEALKAGPVSTWLARETLGIAHPAGRVHEARRLGWSIATTRGTVPDAAGRLHVSAIYTLTGEAPA